MATALLRIAVSLNPNPNADPKIHLGSARALRNPVPFLHPPPLRRLQRLSRPESLILLRANAVDIGVPAGEPLQEAVKSSSVLLDVGGMMCGACAARVRSILSADDRVESAVVNMLTETAAVRLGPGGLEDGDAGRVAEELAGRLTECGFPAKRRRSGLGVGENVRKWREMAERKEELLVRSRNRVAFAWTLVALCCGSHASHILHSLGIHVAHGKISLAFIARYEIFDVCQQLKITPYTIYG